MLVSVVRRNLHQVVPSVWVNLNGVIPASRQLCLKSRFLSAKGAKYESQGQARSAAERLAPGKLEEAHQP
jgi:hypothetical protein